MINREMIEKAEQFLKETLEASPYLQEHPSQLHYRLEHSYRVANLCREIARAEGLDETAMILAGLLHDLAYCQEMATREQWREHGRQSAKLARPFLETLGLPQDQVQDILFGIAVHVDDVAGFQWRRTAFAETVGDADNLDRFDVYRICETLETKEFTKLPLPEKLQWVKDARKRLEKLRGMPLGTHKAMTMWDDKVDFGISFYERLEKQLEASKEIL